VLAALANPQRKVLRILATPMALARLSSGCSLSRPPGRTTPRDLDTLVGGDAFTRRPR